MAPSGDVNVLRAADLILHIGDLAQRGELTRSEYRRLVAEAEAAAGPRLEAARDMIAALHFDAHIRDW